MGLGIDRCERANVMLLGGYGFITGIAKLEAGASSLNLATDDKLYPREHLTLDKLGPEPHRPYHGSVVLERCLHKLDVLLRTVSLRDVAHPYARRLHLPGYQRREWRQVARVRVSPRQVEQQITSGEDAQLLQ